MNGRVLIGVSAEVILDRDACLIRYRDDSGAVIVTRQAPGLDYGDSVTIPFYGDVAVDCDVRCSECEGGDE